MNPGKGFFITGTDTDVGKTFITAAWTRKLRASGTPALALKPVSCGDRADAEIFAKANDETLTLNEINPVTFNTPAAPYTASMLEDRPLDWSAIESNLESLTQEYDGPFLIEGAGGWLVPMDQQFMIRDWAQSLGLPVVIVARLGLGTINHTLLTVESVRASGLEVHCVILNPHNCPEDIVAQTNPGMIEALGKVRVAVFPNLP